MVTCTIILYIYAPGMDYIRQELLEPVLLQKGGDGVVHRREDHRLHLHLERYVQYFEHTGLIR